MTDERFQRVAQNLVKAACMSADELASKKGEGDLFVQIKRNSERLSGCVMHDFDPDPDWRDRRSILSSRTVHCRNCGGDMKVSDAMNYLRGYCHGSGRNFEMMTSAIWPKEPPHGR